MHADPLDNAAEAEEMFRNSAINSIRAKQKPIVAEPECLHCLEPLIQLPDPAQPPRRWCNADCRDQWQRRQQ